MSVPIPTSDTVPTTPPFISVAGIPNFRDLGGYPTKHAGHSIKQKLIYRCAEPSQVTQDGISTMQRLGITHTYDLRSSKGEIEKAKATGRGEVVEWEGCERVLVPVFDDISYSPEALAIRFKDYALDGTDGFTRAYTEILNHAPPSYRIILLHLANEPNKPLIVHCTAGKDRTGVLCALILSLCGVDDDIVAHEYSLTEVGISKEWKEDAIKYLMNHPSLSGNEKGARNLISAKAVNMLSTLQIIREKFGSAEGYVIDKCGLTKEEVEKIKSNLIVKESAVHHKPTL